MEPLKTTISQSLEKGCYGNHIFNIVLAIVALIILCVATLLPVSMEQKMLMTTGTLLLATSAILEKDLFFGTLQVIAVIGTLLAYTALDTYLKAGIIILLAGAAVVYFLKNEKQKDFTVKLGAAALVALGIGFSLSNPIVYLIGGVLIASYAYFSLKKGIQIALVFLILNIVFTITSAIGTYHFLLA